MKTAPRLRVRLLGGADDLSAVHALRRLCFREGSTGTNGLDAQCQHVVIEEGLSGRVLCAYRMLPLVGADIATSYSAQFYDLSRLSTFQGPMVEMGRFCVHPDHAGDPDILRLAWAEMTRYVDAHEVTLLFGCSSFQGTNYQPYLDTFARLSAGHLAPECWLPRAKAGELYDYTKDTACSAADPKQGLRAMPPLLRTYIAMGGWVSDHAVIDREMDTLHVFTGVEIAAIPAARKRALRALVS